MIEFAKRLLWDESAFERYARAALFALAGAASQGAFEGSPTWVVPVLMALGGLIGAGDRNTK